MTASRATPPNAVAGRSDAPPLRYAPLMRALVLSDIHANIVALDAVLADAPSVDEVWQLGDVVGYGPEPDAVVGRLRDLGAKGVRGNHDAAALGGDEIESFNVDARHAMEWTRTVISEATRQWLASLPERSVMGDWTLVHGSPRDPLWEYITSTPVARAAVADLETPHGLHGHTHVPIGFVEEDGVLGVMSPGSGSTLEVGGRRTLLNPGSVGQPRDGIPAASWMVVDTVTGSVTWHRTAYDIGAVQETMETVGLPSRLVERLAYGL
jgi:diadenosine tetraphosphatase ApaH/serine/threonine PP2A family protein phosphatase